MARPERGAGVGPTQEVRARVRLHSAGPGSRSGQEGGPPSESPPAASPVTLAPAPGHERAPLERPCGRARSWPEGILQLWQAGLASVLCSALLCSAEHLAACALGWLESAGLCPGPAPPPPLPAPPSPLPPCPLGEG